MKTIVNLTGHDLRIIGILYPHMGRARMDSKLADIGRIETHGASIPMLEIHEQGIVDLPGPRPGTIYVVSGIVAAAAQREDVFAPSRTTRDGHGRILGCSALVRPVPMRANDEKTRKDNDEFLR